MKTKYKVLISLILGVFLVNFVLASSVNFYYSPNCPHCESVKPLMNSLKNNYIQWQFNFMDVTKGSYNVRGVPFVTIFTSDKRKIDLVGSREIPKYLECELNEVTTLGCPTYSISEGYNLETQSWFIR